MTFYICTCFRNALAYYCKIIFVIEDFHMIGNHLSIFHFKNWTRYSFRNKRSISYKMSLYDLELEPPFSDVVTDDELAVLNIKDLNRFHSIRTLSQNLKSFKMLWQMKKNYKTVVWFQNHAKSCFLFLGNWRRKVSPRRW